MLVFVRVMWSGVVVRAMTEGACVGVPMRMIIGFKGYCVLVGD